MFEGSPLWYPGAPSTKENARGNGEAQFSPSMVPVSTPIASATASKPPTNASVPVSGGAKRESPASTDRSGGDKHVKMTPLLSPLTSYSSTPATGVTPLTKR